MSKMMNSEFNSVMYVNVELNNKLKELCMNFGKRLIEECSREYGFSSEEAMRKLCISDMELRMEEKVSKKSRTIKTKKTKSCFPLPFSGEMLEGSCHGLKKNGGLYTQCEMLCNGEGLYCVNCQMQADKNSNGKPDSGTIEDRMSVGLYEFRDPSGKMPISYRKVMSKLNLSDEMVLSEGERMGRNIPLEHLSYVVEKKKGRPSSGVAKVKEVKEGKKGRPKKSKKILEVDNESSDLFASLVLQANASSDSESESDSEVNLSVISEHLSSCNEESNLKEEEKKAKDAEKEAKRQAAEAEKARKEEEKKAKEEEKKAKEAEKEAKRQAVEAEKARKEEEKKAKEEAKKAKEEAKKAKEEAKKAKEEGKEVTKKSVAKEEVKKAEVEEKKDDNEPDVVKRFEYEGKKYLKSKKTGVVYNMDQDVVGKFNEETQKIEFLEAESEEEEEEYESDDE